MNADRPLTDPQERALIAYDEYEDRHPGAWAKLARLNTMEALEKRGYLAIRWIGWTELGQITAAGRELLRGMGD